MPPFPLRSRHLALPLAIALTFVLAPSASAATACDGRPLSQPFLPWLDPAYYVLAPRADFESGLPHWKVDGAKIVEGNEPWKVGGASHAYSLALPAGASATTPGFCAGLEYPTVRLFSKSANALATLRVDVLYTDQAGLLASYNLGTVPATAAWELSPHLLTLSGLPLLTGSEIALRFTAVGGDFTIDDVYVDPYYRR